MPCWILNVITVKVTGARAPEGPCGEEPPHANDVNSAAAAIARKYRIPPSEQRRCRRTEARAWPFGGNAVPARGARRATRDRPGSALRTTFCTYCRGHARGSMKFSIVIATYNRADELRRTLDSLAALRC